MIHVKCSKYVQVQMLTYLLVKHRDLGIHIVDTNRRNLNQACEHCHMLSTMKSIHHSHKSQTFSAETVISSFYVFPYISVQNQPITALDGTKR